MTRSLAANSILVAAGLCAASCTIAPPGAGGDAPSLGKHGSQYSLNRPLRDFDDSIFVLTEAGTSAPRVVSVAQLAKVLASYDVVFYGEYHSHPGVHLQELELLRNLYQQDPRWIVSLEQFERDTQGVVDAYLAGKIGENALIDQGHAWKDYLTAYRPLLVFAQAHHLPVVAAEAPGWAVSCIGQWGPAILGAFTPAERAWVAENLDTSPGPYRDKFMRFVGNSPSHGGDAKGAAAQMSAERSFAAQIARDDTMAESIERARAAHPGYKVFHVTGTFHAEQFLGTVERLKQLQPSLRVAVVDAIQVENPTAPSFASDDVQDGTALQLVYPTPDLFVDGEDMSGFSAKIRKEREASQCRYSLGPASAPARGPAVPSTPAPAPAAPVPGAE